MCVCVYYRSAFRNIFTIFGKCSVSDARPSTVKHLQKQPSKGVVSKRCYENMQLIYGRKPMLKCDFNKVALQLY